MFENLTDKLERSFKILKGEGRISEINIAETLKEIRRALIDADVNYKVAKSFTDEVKQKALGQNVLKAVKPGQMMTKIVRDELAQLMGGTATDIRLEGTPAVILIAGLQGSGKTTFSGKLAAMLKSKKGRQVLLVAGDVYRPAAIKQLQILGEQIGVPVYSEGIDVSPVTIAKNGLAYAKKNFCDMVFIDTAGRLHIDEALMGELQSIKAETSPTEILLTVDSMIGQDAVNVAEKFNEMLDITGVILTKLDGDTRGGAALSVRYVTGKPIKFIGVGEKIDAIEPFYPDRMASRILGMGDVLTLIDKAQAAYDEKQAEELERKIREQSFTLDDYLDQFAQIKNMGSMEQLLGMMPGVNASALKDAKIDEKAVARTEAIIKSMTPRERAKPDILNYSRRKRIAEGSGTSIEDVNRLLKQFEQTKKLMKQFSSAGKFKGGRKKKGMKFPF